ncbi:STAS domain-containing protein [Saccharothrix deserti]|uniref:STAS domain-containing protein n=1 Tax=Saccharothrix deserti TaxID=2593674 RepID=UPI002367F315|nr:STAS domain-containing protein [Saccharothrix deserti]
MERRTVALNAGTYDSGTVFSCDCQTRDGTTMITVSGEVDIRAAEEIQDHLVWDGAGPTRIRLDLGAVTFMAVAGLAVLLHAADLCRDRGMDLTLIASPEVMKVIDLVHATAGLSDHLVRAGADESEPTQLAGDENAHAR